MFPGRLTSLELFQLVRRLHHVAVPPSPRRTRYFLYNRYFRGKRERRPRPCSVTEVKRKYFGRKPSRKFLTTSFGLLCTTSQFVCRGTRKKVDRIFVFREEKISRGGHFSRLENNRRRRVPCRRVVNYVFSFLLRPSPPPEIDLSFSRTLSPSFPLPTLSPSTGRKGPRPSLSTVDVPSGPCPESLLQDNPSPKPTSRYLHRSFRFDQGSSSHVFGPHHRVWT